MIRSERPFVSLLNRENPPSVQPIRLQKLNSVGNEKDSELLGLFCVSENCAKVVNCCIAIG